MTADTLKQQLREIRNSLDKDHAVRLHRAISWLRCAERYSADDLDVAFVALWISFNACYGVEDPAHLDMDERTRFNTFAEKLCLVDNAQRIHTLLWRRYSQFVRMLIDNHWVYGPYWAAVRAGRDDWQASFEQNRKLALRALADNDTPRLLSIILDRLYVLRNQMLHGGATYQSTLNRDQVRDSVRLLWEFMPVCIELMFTPGDWGAVYYPIVEA